MERLRMVRRLILAAALSLSAAGPAVAKVKRCFSAVEIRAEQEVRHGVFLRESANRCEGPWVVGMKPVWDDFALRFAAKLAKATDRRSKAYQREFPDRWPNVLTHADGRIVTYYRHFPLTRAYCENVNALVTEVGRRGWGGFSEQAKTIQNEVIGEVKACQ